MKTETITNKIISAGLDYTEYRDLITMLLAEGKTTGTKQTPARVEFTKLNVQRMNRLDKTTALITPLAIQAATLKNKQTWVLLAQAWCGDCAQIVPVIAKVAAIANQMVNLQILNPDEHPDLMDAYLTNGARSVPKLIILDSESQQELSTWGPRPEPAQKIMLNWKNNPETITWEEFERELHTWYAKDRTITTQNELLNLPIWHLSK